MASKSGRGQKRNSGSRETRDRRSVSRGNTIHRATTRHLDEEARSDELWYDSSDEDEDVYPIEDNQLFPPGPVGRMAQGQEVGRDYIFPQRRDFNDEVKLTGRRRQSLLNLANQMEQENADFIADFGNNRISAGKTELPREVTRQIAEFAVPNYISDLTKTNAGEPSKRIARLARDRRGRKVIKREKPTRGNSSEEPARGNSAEEPARFYGPSIGLTNWNPRAVPTKAHKGGKRKSKRRRRTRKRKSHKRKTKGRRKKRKKKRKTKRRR